MFVVCLSSVRRTFPILYLSRLTDLQRLGFGNALRRSMYLYVSYVSTR